MCRKQEYCGVFVFLTADVDTVAIAATVPPPAGNGPQADVRSYDTAFFN